MKGISQREFARRDGCDEKVVRRKLQSGHLKALDDGTLDPKLVGTPWRRRNAVAKPIQLEDEPRDETEDTAAEAERLVLNPGFQMLTKAEAEQKKENYLALLKELDYDLKAGNVVASDDVMAIVVQEFSRVRNKLLSIPTKLAHRVIMLKDADEAKAMMDEEIALVLQDLTYDVRKQQPLS